MRTTASILGRADKLAVNWMEREAQATVDVLQLSPEKADKILARFRASAPLPKDDKALMVELSPDVCQELRIDPKKMALGTFFGFLGLHMLNLWQCVDELRELRRERAAMVQLNEPTSAGSSADAKSPGTSQPLPTPARPAGALPEVK